MIEREEWLIVMLTLADIRDELQRLNHWLQKGDNDGEEDKEADA